ncbi:DUF4327 family protein [Altericista sp. CCNU0014]|uniref:DUF4327 family protein n=1 Tax=Altericista sp. CCNU0014 TaxID=3082949 RepID=UPI00384CD9D3
MNILRQYTITDLQEEVRALVSRGLVNRQQRIYELSRHFSDRQWHNVEQLLTENNFLLRDRVIELAGKEAWISD